MGINAHTFNVDLAAEIGLTEAILLQHFYYWHQHNTHLPEMHREDRVWFFRSVAEMREVFPYLSDGNVRTAIKHLIEQGLVIKGDYSEKSLNKSTWYSLTDVAIRKFHLQDSSIPFVESQNGFVESYKSISNSNKDSSNKIIRKRDNIFNIPTLSEISNYCRERGNIVDPQQFFDYYTSNGWMVGRNKMKDWKAAVRTWEGKRQSRPAYQPRKQESVFEANARAVEEIRRKYENLNNFTDEQ